MPYFIMLTRLSSSEVRTPSALEALEKKVITHIRSECPQVEWIANYAVLGPYDYLDVFRAADPADAFRVSTIVRLFGHARTEIWAAEEWGAFKAMIRDLPQAT
ncbi:MAG TPA: GYD domain-containing protein [Desulfobacterales bacterium]|nr:GYD domain-containing protein [Desulfobacterales bacterium]